jgi:nitrogen regulatory protein PII
MPLKEILAIVRPELALETEAILISHGAEYVSRQSVFGRGKEMGQRLFRSWFVLKSKTSPYLRKTKLSALVEAKQIPKIVDKIIAKNRSKRYGDGRIFILPVAGE